VPFEHLVEVLNPQRDVSHTPLFQAMLVLQNTPAADLALDRLDIRAFGLDSVTAKYDLTLHVAEHDGQLACSFEYAAELFDASTIERLAGHLRQLLAAIAQDPAQRVEALPLMDAAERARLFDTWTGAQAPARRETVHRLFDDQAAATPDGTAVVCGTARMDYADLQARANRLAQCLRAQGVGPDVPVALCMRRSLDRIVAVLGILKAGGAYLPLDLDYPAERLRHMLQDARPRVLLCDPESAADLPTGLPAGLPVLPVDADALAAWPAQALQDATTADNLAYIVYTSGSTGIPKGVAVTHGNVVRLVHRSDYFEAGPGTRVLHFASLNFDAATFELWAPLLNGGTVVVAPPERQSIEQLAELLAAQRIDTLWLTATVFNQMVERQLQAFAPVRHVLTGGEALSLPHVRRFLGAGFAARLTNGYGPTESTTFACCHAVSPAALEGASVPIGRPIANTEVCVLDADGQPLPVGVAGELHIAGRGLARGYLGQPGLTAERFVPNPFASDGSRLYRTGDLVRSRPDGTLEYLGRTDTQIKIRGFRIETGEVEAALLAVPGVGEAVVTAPADADGQRQLVAHVVRRPGAAEIDAAVLRAALRRRLPDYMIPAHFVMLERLPVTPNGKVDHRALPQPDLRRGERGYVPPGTPIEAMLADVWARVLKRDKVGIHDNFFELGGHSLSATQAVSEVREQVQMDLPLRSFFEHPTIGAIAPVLEALMLEHVQALSEDEATRLLAREDVDEVE
jgi:amino acid adenylation domain-containing protein